MQKLFLEKLHSETHLWVHILHRDMARRLATLAFVLFLCGVAEKLTTTVIIGLILYGFEAASYLINRKALILEKSMSTRRATGIWFIGWSSLIFYFFPTLALVQTGSIALIVAGYMWMFGVYVYVTNTFSLLPFYNWSLMIPSFIASIPIFWVTSTVEVSASPPLHWLFAAGLMLIYSVNTFETMNKQKDTSEQLKIARREANQRLQELEHLTRHDALTGLINRRAFDQELAAMLNDTSKPGQVGVFVLDLDGFKPINDNYSHDAGDMVLVGVANRLRSLLHDNGFVARLGGDEFALVFSEISSPSMALFIGDKIAQITRDPIRYNQHSLSVGGSVGVALAHPNTVDVATICAQADRAMYRAKSAMDNATVIFDPATFPTAVTTFDRQTLCDAMENRQIMPFYQPKICLKTETICGFEALARWQHPTQGLVSPDKFLPAISEHGLQGEFLLHIAKQVLTDIKSWMDLGLLPGQVSLNLPEVTLATLSGRNDFERLLHQFPDVRNNLTIEITEDVFLARAGNIIRETITHFRKSGIRVALDDFGTGFASFQHLRELEFDELKLDTSFVDGLCDDPIAEVLVKGLLSIGQGLNVLVVAEGVETIEQANRLRQIGYEVVQGHYYSPAIPFPDATAQLTNAQKRTAHGDAQLDIAHL